MKAPIVERVIALVKPKIPSAGTDESVPLAAAGGWRGLEVMGLSAASQC